MEVIVPLAGPDFEFADGTTKAEVLVEGIPLLLKALTSRSWWRQGEVSSSDFIFVLRDTSLSKTFIERSLRPWFPNSRVTLLSQASKGAAFSALAGIALCDPKQLLCVDLADIIYTADLNPAAIFKSDAQLGGLVPTFESSWPLYSYVKLADNGIATQTAEKQVISSHASAGTYFFRDSALYLGALEHSVKNASGQTFRGSYFICPLFNGVIASGLDVRTYDVTDVIDLKHSLKS